MSAAATADTFNIRHRLVGAVVLIVFAVIVLPMVLKGNTRDPIEVDIRTPSQQREPREFISRIQPVGGAEKRVIENEDGKVIEFTTGADPAPAPTIVAQTANTITQPPAPPPTPAPEVQTDTTTAASGGSAETASAANTTVAVAPTIKAPVKAPVSTPEKAPAKPAKKPGVSNSTLEVKTDRGWIVRIGAFGKPANARNISRLLESKGFEPRLTREKTREGKVITRVWVGPYGERVTAGRVQDKIEGATGEKGFITPYP